MRIGAFHDPPANAHEFISSSQIHSAFCCQSVILLPLQPPAGDAIHDIFPRHEEQQDHRQDESGSGGGDGLAHPPIVRAQGTLEVQTVGPHSHLTASFSH